MQVLQNLVDRVAGLHPLQLWLAAFLLVGLVAGIATGYFRARKIQPKGFKWRTFRNECIFAVINLAVSGTILGAVTQWLVTSDFARISREPAAWWVIALEYAAYFFLFDTWFYWLHRAMHKEPIYRYVHKLHHFSTSPNLMTTLSVNPLESFINGGFVPLFVLVMPVLHVETMALVAPTNIIMGLYVHSGYELLPRWWNTSWATKWFISATFHDHHHKYFNYNFGGYTTIWDRICGTVRKNFDSDFEKIKDRARTAPAAVPAPGTAAAGIAPPAE